MFLAFQLSDLVTVPFGWLLGVLYQFTGNYGLAMILFAILVKVILLPITAKSKKSMMKMSRLQPRIQEIQRKYENDKQKQNEAMQQLQREEGASMGCGGCLWSFVPLLILIPLFGVIRQPLEYILMLSAEEAAQIVEIIKAARPEVFNNSYYDQMFAAPLIPEFAEAIKTAIPGISDTALEGMDFTFLGIDLGRNPAYNIFSKSFWDWAHIGAALIPILSAGSQVLSMFISQKMNNSVITNEKGLEDKEAAARSQSAQTSKMMMWTMPVVSLLIGFSYPAGLSLYWCVQGLVSILIDVYLTKKYRTMYDAEDALKLQRALELEAIEAEKERIRAEKRAANPDGITANTSKKKLQQKQRAENEAAKAEAAREYAARRGMEPAEDADAEDAPLSGNADRPFSKGRAYNPNRYNSTEE